MCITLIEQWFWMPGTLMGWNFQIQKDSYPMRIRLNVFVPYENARNNFCTLSLSVQMKEKLKIIKFQIKNLKVQILMDNTFLFWIQGF